MDSFTDQERWKAELAWLVTHSGHFTDEWSHVNHGSGTSQGKSKARYSLTVLKVPLNPNKLIRESPPAKDRRSKY